METKEQPPGRLMSAAGSGRPDLGYQPKHERSAVQDLLCQGSVPSTTQSPVLQPDAIPQRYQEDLIDFGSPSVDIPGMLLT